jgi:hypothetical protein
MNTRFIALFLLTANTAVATASALSFAFGTGYDDDRFPLRDPLLIQTIDKGSSWSLNDFSSDFAGATFQAGTCNGQMCVVLGNIDDLDSNAWSDLILQSYDNGATWHPASIDKDHNMTFSDVDCSESICVAIGSYAATKPVVIQTTNGGASWSTVRLRGDITSSWLESVSCVEDYCVIAANTWASEDNIPLLLQTSDAGKTWSQANLRLPEDAYLNAVDCNAETCVAVGGRRNLLQPFLVQTPLSGIAWTAQTIKNIPENGTFVDVTCTDKVCAAVGNDDSGPGHVDSISFIATMNNEKQWSSQEVFFESGQRLHAIACDNNQCIASGDMITSEFYKPVLITNLNGSWEQISFPSFPSSGQLHSVSCSDDFCLATGIGDDDAPLLMQSIRNQPWEIVNIPALQGTRGFLVGAVAR